MTPPLKVVALIGREEDINEVLGLVQPHIAKPGMSHAAFITGGGDAAAVLDSALRVYIDGVSMDSAEDASLDPAPAAVPARVSDDAAVLSQALKGLAVPARAWEQLEVGPRQELVSKLYEDRREYAKQARWLTSPELTLLDKLDAPDKRDLAKALLKHRNGLTDEDIAAAQEHNAAAAARTAGLLVENDVLGEAKGLLHQFVEDRKTWRGLAKVSTGLLIVSVAVSVAALAFVLLDLANDNGFDSWTIPVIIFALAVFVASPTALLLTEKPLKGINEWMPTGKASAEPASTPTANKESKAAEETTTGGAAKYTKGPGKPD